MLSSSAFGSRFPGAHEPCLILEEFKADVAHHRRLQLRNRGKAQYPWPYAEEANDFLET